jgi:asparagine synthase (glutamine-hydrolysing)
MSGFSGYFLISDINKLAADSFVMPNKLNDMFDKMASVEYSNGKVVWYSNSKFKNDKGLFAPENGVIGFDGVNLNEDCSQENWINSCVTEKIIGFPSTLELGDYLKSIRGAFSGLVLANSTLKLQLFTDHTGSHPVFYYHDSTVFFFSSSIFLVRDFVKHLNLNINLNHIGAYQLLTYGYFLGSHTLVSEIKKLEPGRILSLDRENKRNIHTYYSYTSKPKIEIATASSIELLDDLFKKSIDLEYKKDLQYNYKHIGQLSGGLDSRLNVMMANEIGFRNQTNITFGQNESIDEEVAREISTELQNQHLIILLGNGNYLLNYELALKLNNCSVYFFGAAQTLYANQTIHYSQYGLNHNGILAESSKGGYLTGTSHNAPNFKNWGVTTKLFHKIESEIQSEFVGKYESDEMFALYNRGFNAIHNGTWMTEPYTSSVYTYLEPNFADYAFSFSPKLRNDARLTIDWISQKHPAMIKYRWKYNINPTNNKLTLFSGRVLNRVKLMSGKNEGIAVPISEWFQKNSALRDFLNTTIVDLNLGNAEMENDINFLFKEGSVIEKFLAVNFVKAYHLIFNK